MTDDELIFPVMVASFTSDAMSSWFPHPATYKYDLILSNANGPYGKATIEGTRDEITAFSQGAPIDADWYRKTDEGWEFIERRPLTFTFKKEQSS